jgi:hypothetical protein
MIKELGIASCSGISSSASTAKHRISGSRSVQPATSASTACVSSALAPSSQL